MAVREMPETVTLDGARLIAARRRLGPDEPALRTLVARADATLTTGPWSVTDKPQLPPSGDRHDYLSQAPYWWPTAPATPDNPWGCPYERRDGERNPAIREIPDHAARAAAFDAIYTLALAWFYTGNSAYAGRAALDLRTWFLDPVTRMNPSLNYTQFIPGMLDGRGIGIIDLAQALPNVIDAAAILDAGAPSWSETDRRGLRDWFGAFLDWLLTSQNGMDEAATENNHGSFYDEQAAALALYTGRRGLAREIAETAAHKRIDAQIAADGSQPEELRRTRSWHYSVFNLVALTRLASIGQKVGVDLWRHAGPNGSGILDAVHFLLPAAVAGAAAWPHPELSFEVGRAREVIHAAADIGDPQATEALGAMPEAAGGDLWPLRPAAG
ncbi:MAG TPA: alginate lyase family protein [Mycobacteriales bacterium]|jgi:hypothetical protein|nr:alginate lyase family protein [Mycobacteriales bacterium]